MKDYDIEILWVVCIYGVFALIVAFFQLLFDPWEWFV